MISKSFSESVNVKNLSHKTNIHMQNTDLEPSPGSVRMGWMSPSGRSFLWILTSLIKNGTGFAYTIHTLSCILKIISIQCAHHRKSCYIAFIV